MKNIEEIINEIGGQHIGIYAENLNSGTSIEINSEDLFPAASVIKLPILSALYKKFILGELSPESEIEFSEADLVDDSPWFEQTGVTGGRVKLYDTAHAMVTVSDNTATNLLIDLLGFDYINNEIIVKGMYNTALKRKMCDFAARERGLENISTPFDIALFFKALIRESGFPVKYEIIKNWQRQSHFDEKTASLETIRILTELKDLEKIPSGLDLSSYLVAGKPGELPDIRNDSALIISKADENFIICIFCEKVSDDNKTDALIGELAGVLLEYLKRE